SRQQIGRPPPRRPSAEPPGFWTSRPLLHVAVEQLLDDGPGSTSEPEVVLLKIRGIPGPVSAPTGGCLQILAGRRKRIRGAAVPQHVGPSNTSRESPGGFQNGGILGVDDADV